MLTFASVPMQSRGANIEFCCTRLKMKLGHVDPLVYGNPVYTGEDAAIS